MGRINNIEHKINSSAHWSGSIAHPGTNKRKPDPCHEYLQERAQLRNNKKVKPLTKKSHHL
jgi:hypothetical protein